MQMSGMIYHLKKYAQTKYEFADQLITMIEKVYPKVRDHVEELQRRPP